MQPRAKEFGVNFPQDPVRHLIVRIHVEIVDGGRIRANFQFVVQEIVSYRRTINRKCPIEMLGADRACDNHIGVLAANWIKAISNARRHKGGDRAYRRTRHENHIACRDIVDIFDTVGITQFSYSAIRSKSNRKKGVARLYGIARPALRQ